MKVITVYKSTNITRWPHPVVLMGDKTILGELEIGVEW